MDSETVTTITDWESVCFDGSYTGLQKLADREFSGAITTGSAWALMINGRLIGIPEGSLSEFKDQDGTAYKAPDPALPLLYAMQSQESEKQATYYTGDTPITQADEMLSSEDFTGYIELSENVYSGEYYVVYYGGRSMSVAFVGNNRELLFGEEAFERANDEGGVYEVYPADIDIIEIPEESGKEPISKDNTESNVAPSNSSDVEPDTVSDKILGIDFGTANSVAAVLEDGEPETIVNSWGERTIPSIVVSDEGEKLVGSPAREQAIQNPDNTVRSIKRHLGEADYTVNLAGKEYSPEEISGMILKQIAQEAQEYLDSKINEVVISVPTQFNHRQRHALHRAAENVGLEVQRIIEEPAAAAMAYGFDDDSDQTVLVYDLGGGSFSVSVYGLGGGVFDPIANSGDNQLGGDDWDQAIVDHLSDEFEDRHGIDLQEDQQAFHRLIQAAKEAKHDLSSREKTKIDLPFIATTDSGPIDFGTSLTRETFEDITKELIERTVDPIEEALQTASVSPNDIDKVLLVGGATRMPQVSDKVEEVVGQTPTKNVNPDEAVALGAAVQGGVLAGDVDDIVLLDVTPQSLGIEVKGGVFERLIEKNTTIPTDASKVFTAASDNQTSVQVRVFEGEREIATENEFLGSLTLEGISEAKAGEQNIEITFEIDENSVISVEAEELDTGRSEIITITHPTESAPDQTPPDIIVLSEGLPLSLGIKIEGGKFERLAEKNTTTPVSFSEVLTTTTDDQTSVQIRVFKGEHEIAEENEYLSEIELTEIQPAPAGTPHIEITGSVDEDKTVHISAEEEMSGKGESITIENGLKLSEENNEPVSNDPEDDSHAGQTGRTAGSDKASYTEEGSSYSTLTPVEAEPSTGINTLKQVLSTDSPVNFNGGTVLVETLADGTADFENETELLDTLVEMAVDISDEERLFESLMKERGEFDDQEDIRELLQTVVEESINRSRTNEISDTIIHSAIDVRDNLNRCYQYCERNRQSASAVDDRFQKITEQLDEVLNEITETTDGEARSSSEAVGYLYRTFLAIRKQFHHDEITVPDIASSIRWTDTALGAVGCTVVAPERGTSPDPYRHEVWTTIEDDLPEGEIVQVEEVGYEVDGDLKKEAKVVISEESSSVPETIPSPPQSSITYQDLNRGEVIGRGGNADVYRATVDGNECDQELAIKEPRINDTLHTGVIESMLEEAEMWQQLDSHDHIVSVVDYDSDPLPWIAMEYMDAGHLGERAGEKPFNQALWTALAITKAVRHAHEHGVVHLDLKPENILFKRIDDAWDVPKVADWGLSKQLLNHSRTTEGMSPHYAAPEQFDSEQFGSTDKATDVYQLGAVCYELFTGRPPFEGKTFEVVNKIQSDDPTPPSQIADVPSNLDKILLTALSTQKANRFEHVLYLRDEFQKMEDSY